MKTLLIILILAGLARPAGSGAAKSIYIKSEFALTPDPNSAEWKNVPGVFATNDSFGKPVPGHRTEIRSRWTDKNIYFLFVCPYETLHLKPNPEIKKETNKLWDWD